MGGLVKNIGVLIVAAAVDGLQVAFVLGFFAAGAGAAGLGIPVGAGLGIIVNAVLGMLGGLIISVLLIFNRTFYPGRFAAGFFSESLIPILNNLPIWTIVVATSIFKKEVRKHVVRGGIVRTLTGIPRTVVRSAVGATRSQAPEAEAAPSSTSLPQGPATQQPPQRIALQDIRSAKSHAHAA